METVESRLKHYVKQNERLKKDIKRTEKLVRELVKTADWIRKNKATPPTEFDAVIRHYMIWNTTRKWLLEQNKNIVAFQRKELRKKKKLNPSVIECESKRQRDRQRISDRQRRW